MTRERRELAQQLQFFDCSIWLGKPQGFPLADELLPETLASTLSDRFITGGLVSHWHGNTISAQDVNTAVIQGIDGRDNLSAIWTGLPLFPEEDGELPGCVEPPSCVKGVRIFPKSHGLPLEHWSVGTLCDWLAKRNMPLLVWHTEVDWQSLYRLAERFCNLKIVLETQPRKILYHTRPLFALMRDCANVLVEISNFVGAGFIEYAVSNFGAQRLLFGSFLPVNDPLVSIGMLLDAEISHADKAAIAGGNLRQLLSEVQS